MLNALLYSQQSVLDFILQGRTSHVVRGLQSFGRISRTGAGSGSAREDGHRIENRQDDAWSAALVEYMDALTDARIVREAVVYRALLVN